MNSLSLRALSSSITACPLDIPASTALWAEEEATNQETKRLSRFFRSRTFRLRRFKGQFLLGPKRQLFSSISSSDWIRTIGFWGFTRGKNVRVRRYDDVSVSPQDYNILWAPKSSRKERRAIAGRKGFKGLCTRRSAERKLSCLRSEVDWWKKFNLSWVLYCMSGLSVPFVGPLESTFFLVSFQP